MFQLHRVFCATPWELEAERRRFDELVGAFNEAHCVGHGILFVPASLANIRDKRPLQYVVDENIQDSTVYVLLLAEDWGPVERNFRKDYHLAQQCLNDPSLPMSAVSILHKRLPGEPSLPEGIPQPDGEFSTMAEFADRLNELLSKTLASLAAK